MSQDQNNNAQGMENEVPIQAAPMNQPSGNEGPSKDKGQQEEGTPQIPKPRKKRVLKQSTVKSTSDVFFKLYKFHNDNEEYLLEMYTVGTDSVKRYRLETMMDRENVGKWTIEVYHLETGNHNVMMLVEDPSRPKFLKWYPYALETRLNGWVIEERIRNKTKKEETFFVHWSHMFRSLKEASGFLLYSCVASRLIEVRYQSDAEVVPQLPVLMRNPHQDQMKESENVGTSSDGDEDTDDERTPSP